MKVRGAENALRKEVTTVEKEPMLSQIGNSLKNNGNSHLANHMNNITKHKFFKVSRIN